MAEIGEKLTVKGYMLRVIFKFISYLLGLRFKILFKLNLIKPYTECLLKRQILLNEDFTQQKEINEKVWNIGYPWGAVLDENVWCEKENLYFDNGLNIRSKVLNEKRSDYAHDKIFKYTSGAISSNGKFNFSKGRIDIKIKSHNVPYTCQALWLLHEGYSVKDFEIRIGKISKDFNKGDKYVYLDEESLNYLKSKNIYSIAINLPSNSIGNAELDEEKNCLYYRWGVPQSGKKDDIVYFYKGFITPEYDILEFMESGNKYLTQQSTVHWGYDLYKYKKHADSSSIYNLDFSKDYHVYSLEITKKSIKWYIDGYLIKIMVDKDVIVNKPSYIIINDNVKENDIWEKNNLSSNLNIQWIRVYN